MTDVNELAKALEAAGDLVRRRANIDAELEHHRHRICDLEAEREQVDEQLGYHGDTARGLSALARRSPKSAPAAQPEA